MNIATWNINGLNARFSFIVHWLRTRKPDVVALQELKLPGDQFPHLGFEAEGFTSVIHTEKAWNGVAILSRKKLEIQQLGLPGQDECGARLVAASCDDFSLINLYCPNGKYVAHPDFKRKLAWYESLLEFISTKYNPAHPLIVCGDFNLCPAPIDSWNEEAFEGEIFHTEAERRLFQRLLDWGLVDVFRRRFPETQEFSWWDYRAGAFHRKQGLRIDFILMTTPLAGKVREVVIDRDYRKKKDGMIASDHAPVIAEVE